jgi:hypothetical protein
LIRAVDRLRASPAGVGGRHPALCMRLRTASSLTPSRLAPSCMVSLPWVASRSSPTRGIQTIRTGSERASEANLAPLRKRRGPGAHGRFRVPARKMHDGRKAGSGPPCVALHDPLASRKGPIPHDTGLFWEGPIKRDRGPKEKPERARKEDNGSPGAEDAGTGLGRRSAL